MAQTVGIANLTNTTNASATGFNTSRIATDVGNAFGSSVAGSAELTGILVLAFWGFVLYRESVPMDVAAAVTVPTVFALGNYGLLPFGEGVVFGAIMAAASVFAFGVADYVSR